MFSEFGFSITMTESEVNKLYRRCCIRFHPDKISQKGIPVTKEDNDKFTRLGNEYETFVNYVKKNSKTESKYYEEAMPQKQQRNLDNDVVDFVESQDILEKRVKNSKITKKKSKLRKKQKEKIMSRLIDSLSILRSWCRRQSLLHFLYQLIKK